MELPIIKAALSIVSYIIFLILVVYSSGSESSSEGITLSQHAVIGPMYLDYVNRTKANDPSAPLHIEDVWLRAHHLDPEIIVLALWIVG